MKIISVQFAISLCLIFFIFGCTSKKDPTHIDLEISTNKELNYNSDGVSSPLMLVFYELQSADKFSKLKYWDLADKNLNKLGKDLISKKKHIIIPNQKQTYKILFNDKSKFFGVIGKFRDIENSQWKQIIDLEQFDYNEAILNIKHNSIIKGED